MYDFSENASSRGNIEFYDGREWADIFYRNNNSGAYRENVRLDYGNDFRESILISLCPDGIIVIGSFIQAIGIIGIKDVYHWYEDRKKDRNK